VASKKNGRNKTKCKAYKDQARQEKNRERKMAKEAKHASKAQAKRKRRAQNVPRTSY
jgi:hypothetical protein